MGKGVEIPCIVGVKIPCLGVDILWIGGKNTKNRVNISCIEGSNYQGSGVKIPCIGGSKYHEWGVDMPWGGGSIYHGWEVKILCIGVNTSLIGSRYTMGMGFAIPWVEGSKYNA
jgi:hypothetical protein